MWMSSPNLNRPANTLYRHNLTAKLEEAIRSLPLQFHPGSSGLSDSAPSILTSNPPTRPPLTQEQRVPSIDKPMTKRAHILRAPSPEKREKWKDSHAPY